MAAIVPEREAPHFLGIDAGGSGSRWALVDAAGEFVAEGQAPGFSALDLHGPGRERLVAACTELARAARTAGRPARAHAGLTGLGPGNGELAALLATTLGIPESAVTLGSDIETAYLDLFEPGQGYLVYAGTGSFAAFLDAGGTLHRAGGRGHLLDDGGGGFWIAREALRRVWRAEDERPGSWRGSPLAQALFEQIGGPEWARTRTCVYGGGRGDVGRLALAVARAADRDPAAAAILQAAGTELARLALAMVGRYGPRPVVLSGGASTLHDLIAGSLRAALPAGIPFSTRPCAGHRAAARLALRAARGEPRPPVHEEES